MQMIKGFAQGHKAVPLVRLEHATPRYYGSVIALDMRAFSFNLIINEFCGYSWEMSK